MIDIHTAMADQLETLPSIGDANAKKFIDGRSCMMKMDPKSQKIILAATCDMIAGMIISKLR